MGDVGQFFVTLGANFNTKNVDLFEQRMKTLEGQGKNVFKGFQKVGAGLTAFAGAGSLAILNLTNRASDLEETTSKFQTVFKGLEASANEFEQNLTKNYGLSTRQSRLFLSSMQDLLVPMGMARKEAGDLSNEIVKLSVDLGSFNNLPTEQVMADIQSALVGNYETMKKYGVVLNATRVEQEVLNMGLAKTKDEITASMKAQAGYNLIVRGSSDAIGDFNRTSDGFANQVRIMKSKIDDLLASLGEKFMPVMKDLVGRVNEFLEFLKNIPAPITQLIAKFILFSVPLAGVVGSLSLMIGFLPQLLTGLAQMGSIFMTLKTILATHPLLAVATAITTIAGALKVYYEAQKIVNKSLAEQEITNKSLLEDNMKRINAIKEEMKNTKLSRIEQENLRKQMKIQLDTREALLNKILEIENKKKEIRENEVKEEKNVIDQVKISREGLHKAQIEMTVGAKDWTLKQKAEELELLRGQYQVGTQQYRAFSEEILALDRQRYSRQIEMTQAVSNEFVSGFGSAFEGMFTSADLFSERLEETFRNIGRVFLEMVGQMIARWLLFKALTGLSGIGILPAGMLEFFPRYQHGGIVAGAIGQKRLAMVEGGERILSPANRSAGGNGGGTTIIEQLNIPVTIEELSDANVDHFVNKIAEKVKEGNPAGVNLAKATTVIGGRRQNEAF